MTRPFRIRLRAVTLLVAMAVWFVNVTLCCQAAARPETRSAASCCKHTAHSHGAPAGDRHADGSCCVGIKDFPAQTVASDSALAAAPAAWLPVVFLNMPGDCAPASAVLAVGTLATGPPGRTSFVELVLQRCLPGRAPPAVA
jgi:hypothetical protein